MVGGWLGDGVRTRRPNDDSLNGSLVIARRRGQVHGPAGATRRDNVNSAEPHSSSRVGVLQKAIKGPRSGTEGRRVIPAKSLTDSLRRASGERGLWMAPAQQGVGP